MICLKKGKTPRRINGAIAAAVITLSALAAAVTAVYCLHLRFPDSERLMISILGVFMIIAICVLTAAVMLNKQLEYGRTLKNLEQLADKINAMAIIRDTAQSYVYVNHNFIKATGYNADDLYDIETMKKVLPEDAFSENLQAIVNSHNEQFIIKGKNGQGICTVWSTALVGSFRSRAFESYIMLSIGSDLTENMRMEQEIIRTKNELAESEKKYSMSMELAEIGLLLKNDNDSGFYVSEQLGHMLALDSESEYASADELRKLFYPKDRIVFDSFISGADKNAASSDDQIHTLEFKALSADMTYHWYQFRYKSVTDKQSGHSSVGGAVLDITKVKEKDQLIERMAYIDEVTQINNRNRFMILGNEVLECYSNTGIDYWVIVIDVDSFHIINDICGYRSGDKLLQQIAGVITSCLTESGLAARIGGDNFALLVRDENDEDLPVRLIRRIQNEISAIGGENFKAQNITCSAGYCRMSDGGDDFSQVLDRAEFALSLSDGARSSMIRYEHSAHDAIIAGNAIEKELSAAIENNELVLFYQPKIDLSNGSVMGAEALVRWVKPDGRIIPPGDFIPVAESSMLITKISHFVLYEACRCNKHWQDIGLSPITVSINLSAIDFYQTDVTEIIQNALKETGLGAKWLDVELTESLALKDINHAVEQMQRIKELGVKLSMDDFGTGYSSLSYIQMLPITLLKLDRSFIMYLENDEISREIVSAVIRIAKSKRIETIAEGIETPGQAKILKASGCDHAQGYFFGKPMPADKFEEFLRTRQTVPADVPQ